jgi:glutathionylspermidine synthase
MQLIEAPTRSETSRASRTEAAAPWRIPAPLRDSDYAQIRRRLILDHCKWDPQVADVCTLATFPLILTQSTWKQLERWAEELTAEALSAEAELLRSPKLLKMIGLPRKLRRLLSQKRESLTPSAARIFRFDFHWTTQGWRISESNSDVPGGLTEASAFSKMMAAHYPDATSAGDPGGAWAEAIARTAGPGGTIALLSAVGYMEDLQVTAYVAQRLRELGIDAQLARAHDLRWNNGHALLHGKQVHAIVRFYQGEWLTRLPRRCGWRYLVRGGRTPVANPVSSLLTESKRFPLTWDALQMDLPTWRALLPQTCDPRDVDWQRSSQWMLKQAFCNTGDAVVSPDLLPGVQWRKIAREVNRRLADWVAQRRFEPVPAITPSGAMFPCIGVYTINGKAAGAYGRLSRGAVVDYAATDVAVLVDNR